MERTNRPWGNYIVLEKTKIINVLPNRKLSLQYHDKRDEFWRIVKGYGYVIIGDEKFLAEEGKSFFIPKKTTHRVESCEEGLSLIEVSTGEVLEEDIIRLEDDYSRDLNNYIVVIASGYFDPIHIGHIEYLRLARNLGDKLIVILNNDLQAALKKDKPFMRLNERKIILESLSFVDEVFISIDSDKTVVKSIEAVFRNERASIFAKGGDRFIGEIPERKICDELGITIIDNLGKKIQSSSWLIGKQTP